MQTGQGALEYLLLIGGAVVVAGIALVLVLGVGQGGTTSVNSTACSIEKSELNATLRVSNGLVGWWKLDSTCQANDLTGNGYKGAAQGGVTIGGAADQRGRAGGATSFGSSSQMVIVGPPYVPLGPNWTIASWFQYPLASGQSWNTLTRGSAKDHQIIVSPSTQHLGSYDNTLSVFDDSGFSMSTLTTGWHHIAAVGSGGTTTFYLDGAAVGSISFQSTSDVTSIGNYGGGGQAWGTMDGVMIFNRALSPGEVFALYNSS